MQPLSIAQQRTVLVVFVMLIGVAAWWQNADGGVDRPVRKFSPTLAPEVFSGPDFTNAEAAWRDLRLDARGNLQIDALTESALLDAMALLNGPHAEASKARMALLLEKQFGATAARQVMELLPRLQRYRQAEQRWWAEKGGRNPPPHEELFQIQDELLGETLAQQLFSEQRRLVKLMLASQQIRNDANLTAAQKAQALMTLQQGAGQRDASHE